MALIKGYLIYLLIFMKMKYSDSLVLMVLVRQQPLDNYWVSFTQTVVLHINGLDIYKDSDEIKTSLGYLPGEITFFEHLKGFEFLKLMADLRGLKDLTYMNELIMYFDLDARSKN